MVLGDVVLPPTARLRLFQTNSTLQPLEFLTLAQVKQQSGVLFQVTLAAESTDYNYLEGWVPCCGDLLR